MRRDLAAYWTWMMQTAPLPMARVLFLIVLASFMEVAGLALLPSILGVAGIDTQTEGKLGIYTRIVAQTLHVVGLRPTLAMLLIVFFVLTSARALLDRVQYMAMIALDQNTLLALRNRLYRAIVGADWSFLSRSRPADFAHTLTSEVTRVGQITILFLMLTAEIIVGIVYVVMAFALSPVFAALIVAAAALLIFLLRGTVSYLHDSGATFSAATQRLFGGMTDVLQHLKTTKTFGAGGQPMRIFDGLNRGVLQAAMETGRRRATAGALFEAGSIVILCTMIYVLVEALRLPAAPVLMLLLIFSRLMPRLQSGHQHFRELASMLPSFGIVMEQIRRCEQAAETLVETDRALPLRTAVAMQGVTFSYEGSSADAVRGVDLVVPCGKVVALVGSSGAGKSTIVDLFMGLLVPRSGRISIDGSELGPANRASWRQSIGYVGQDAPLFNVSVRDNMLWGCPTASDDDIRAALQSAAAAQFVASLPQGLDTLTGENGILFSQGERQRLALARALLRRPALLILDEATNGLDSQTEGQVMRSLRARGPHMTVLLVAHRLSTIRCADLIYVVDNGTIAESGRWDDLDGRRESRFRSLCEAQHLVL